MTLAWGNKLTEVKLTVKNIYGKTVQIEEGHKIKINRIGLRLVGEDFLREANFKANRRDFNRRGTEVYVYLWEQGEHSRLEENEKQNLKASFYQKSYTEKSTPIYLNGLKRACLLVQ